MRNPIFNYDDGNFIYQTSRNMGIDSDGNLHMRMGDNMSMDMDTGELHFNSGWKNSIDKARTKVLALFTQIGLTSDYQLFKPRASFFHFHCYNQISRHSFLP